MKNLKWLLMAVAISSPVAAYEPPDYNRIRIPEWGSQSRYEYQEPECRWRCRQDRRHYLVEEERSFWDVYVEQETIRMLTD